jgi:hypothetical protein
MNKSDFGERESVASVPLEPLIDEHECSRITGRSVASLRRDRLLNKGIPYIKCEALVRYDLRDVREYIQHNRHAGKEAR